jgi:hypothetical protein
MITHCMAVISASVSFAKSGLFVSIAMTSVAVGFAMVWIKLGMGVGFNVASWNNGVVVGFNIFS